MFEGPELLNTVIQQFLLRGCQCIKQSLLEVSDAVDVQHVHHIEIEQAIADTTGSFDNTVLAVVQGRAPECGVYSSTRERFGCFRDSVLACGYFFGHDLYKALVVLSRGVRGTWPEC